MVICGILVFIATIYVGLEYLKNDSVDAMTRVNISGNNDRARSLQNAIEETETTNRTQQRGILAVGFVVVLVAGFWWVKGRANQASEHAHTGD